MSASPSGFAHTSPACAHLSASTCACNVQQCAMDTKSRPSHRCRLPAISGGGNLRLPHQHMPRQDTVAREFTIPCNGCLRISPNSICAGNEIYHCETSEILLFLGRPFRLRRTLVRSENGGRATPTNRAGACSAVRPRAGNRICPPGSGGRNIAQATFILELEEEAAAVHACLETTSTPDEGASPREPRAPETVSTAFGAGSPWWSLSLLLRHCPPPVRTPSEKALFQVQPHAHGFSVLAGLHARQR